MSEAEKQEGQKTVVAFITGLLIGGLLVWVFSSSPETTVTEVTDDTNTTEETGDTTNTESSVTNPSNDSISSATSVVAGNGKLSVNAQEAGDSVTLGEVSYPANEGWIVVRDFANGEGGKILGAARYNLNDGLLPTTISLLRSTVSGNTYQVQFYSENGDRSFDTKTDTAVVGGESTFTAN